MIPLFFCPECKTELILTNDKFSCKICKKKYLFENEIGLFQVAREQKNLDNKIKNLIHEIYDKGYDIAIENFLNLNPELRSSLTYTKYDRSADSIFHCIGNNNIRCLEIKSGLGNKIETLSNIFKYVYSIEFENDLLEFQKIRFNQRKCDNILLAKCNVLKLPFPDNFFDLVLCNGVLESVTELFNDRPLLVQNQLVKELKRVINRNGKIIFGVGNKYGLKTLIKKDRYDQHENFPKQSYSKYHVLFEKNGLYVKSYWVLPSYDKPYFSGAIKDELALKWFFKNIDSLIGNQTLPIKNKLLFSIIEKLDYPFIRKLFEIFSPSFIFCCEKTPLKETLEDWIKRDSSYENFLMLSRRMKILFVLLNKKGVPEKILSVKRYGNEFPNKLEFFGRKLPMMKDPENKAWIEEWFSGSSLNPLNLNEVTSAINWLIKFQDNSKQELMNKNDAMKEIELIKKGLQNVNHGELTQYYKWLDDYEKFIEQNKIFKTSVHGDFWVTNIMINPKTQKIHVVDWELFREKGNPLLDFLLFLYDLMAMTGDEPLETFKKNIDGRGDASKIIDQVKIMMEEHFGFKMDVILLLRFYLMRKMIPKEEEMRDSAPKDNPPKNQSTLYIKMLDILAKK